MLAVALFLLEAALVASYARRLRLGNPPENATTSATKILLLIGLAAVPPILLAATSPEVYPSINPDSGGATGGSLLGSSLGVVALLCLLPCAVGVPGSPRDRLRVVLPTLALLAVHFGWFLALDHGNHSNREGLQIASLASLAVWPPVLVIYLRRFCWPRVSRRWLAALGAWGALLVSTGIVQFLPSVLDRWKFTNALVGHAHLALAGFVTAFNMVVLTAVEPHSRQANGLARRSTFWMWNAGCVAFVTTMLALGTIEGDRPAAVFYGDTVTRLAYAVRWVAGAAMLAASVRWLSAALPDDGRGAA